MTARTASPAPPSSRAHPTPTAGPPAAGAGRPWGLAPALLGLLAGWVALLAWRPLVTEPTRFLVPTLVIGLLTALLGTALRRLRVGAAMVAAAQLLLALLALNVHLAPATSASGLLPTRASLRETAWLVVDGGVALNSYGSPVSVDPAATGALLTACGLAVLLSVDVLALGLRRPSLAALPLLVTLSVPISILTAPLSLPVFAACALLFLRLLATDQLDRLGTVAGDERDLGRRPARAPALTSMWQVATLSVVAALLLAPLVPVTDLLRRGTGGGSGGSASGFQLTAVNPFIRLRRDLVEQTDTPLLYARTEARSTAYVRTTVLDRFTGNEWRPSKRSLPATNDADGVFPQPPGLSPGAGGFEDEWSLQFAPSFASIWLPLPYPIRELDVPGSWRFDDRTLDVAFVGGGAPRGLEYSATAFTPDIDARALDAAVRAPDRLRGPMTAVPANLPAVIEQRAREVTQGAESDFAKAVALQDWFRSEGGFRYSLDQRSGSGMSLLAAFVTDDRVGYCEQFAAAMAAMGRTLGIPSRVVVGFLDGTEQPDGRILYTTDDRHAWPEMYFSGVGWVRFEPTPSQRAESSPPWTRQSLEAPEEEAVPLPAEEEAEQAPEEVATGTDSRPVPGVPLATGPLLVVLAGLGAALVPALVRRWQRRRRLRREGAAELAEGAWAELRASARDVGLAWPADRSPREQARSLAGRVGAGEEERRSLDSLLVRVERGRYGRGGGTATVAPEERTETADTVAAWRRAMLGTVSRRRGWRSRLWPSSWVRGLRP